MSTENTSDWPPLNGLTTKLVPRETASLIISGRIVINAPAPVIWAVLRDTSKYPEWNSFCPQVIIHSQPPNTSDAETKWLHQDTSFTLGVVMNSAKPDKRTDTRCRVTDVSTPENHSPYISNTVLQDDGSFQSHLDKVWRICWALEGSFLTRGLCAERCNEIIDLGEGKGCEYRTWECQGGVLAKMVKWLYQETLKERFGDWCEDLKREAEKRAGEEEERK